MALVPI